MDQLSRPCMRRRRRVRMAAAVVAVATLSGLGIAAADDRGPWTPPLAQRLDVVREFDPPEQRWLAGHRGVDLAAEVGADVLAADDGVVVYAALLAGRGVVSIEHGGIRSTYEPVTAAVHAGEHVSQGQVIGSVEAPAEDEGHCEQSCLHWGARVGDRYLDPMALLDLGPPILLPVGAPVPRGVANSLSVPWHRLEPPPRALPPPRVVSVRPVIQALRAASRLL